MPTVSLSLFGGVGAQFLNNDGTVLAGGKIYTYSAGTTTPLTTYTSMGGSTAHTNPIILDSGGRVPSGEIWNTSPLYKFVLKTSADVTIATYDNVGNVTNVSVEDFTGDGSTVSFTLTNAPLSENTTNVFVDGVYYQKNTYVVVGSVITFTSAPPSSQIEVNYYY